MWFTITMFTPILCWFLLLCFAIPLGTRFIFKGWGWGATLKIKHYSRVTTATCIQHKYPNIFSVQVPPGESQAAKEARLRRYCEKKPSGKIGCPMWVHEQWLNRQNRAEMTRQFELAGWDRVRVSITILNLHSLISKTPYIVWCFRFFLCFWFSQQAAFIKRLTYEKEKSAAKKLETLKGWYSKTEMADELKWDESLSQLSKWYSLSS